tara:strand:+ start:182 stop:487 length:306 start_codon:yes stop_codon:yes gene_type:complete
MSGFSNDDLIADLSMLQASILKLKAKIAQQSDLLEVYRSFAGSTRLLRIGSPKFNMYDGVCMCCGVEYKQGHDIGCSVLAVRRMQRSTNREESKVVGVDRG